MTEQQSYIENSARAKKIAFMKEIVSGYYKQPILDYESKSRKREVIKMKYVTIWLIVKRFKKQISLVEIGKCMNYDHATIIHANRQIENYLSFDYELRKELEDLTAIVDNSLMVIDGMADINEDYDYIGLDSCFAVKDDKAKSLVFSGYKKEEVLRILNLLEMTEMKVMDFQKTGMYLIKKKL
jgi:hypothetical protein